MVELVKGFKDFVGDEAIKRSEIKKILVEIFEGYGFEPAETPIIESEKFVRGENPQDEAVSDIFKLRDKGGRELALRYEFTFQLKRISKNKRLPYKRYQIGEVFRDEPISSRRFRQFTQCDIDTVGSGLKEEAEILSIINDVFLRLGIKPIILVNNRKFLNEVLDNIKISEKSRRGYILREIDKIDKVGEMVVKNNLKKIECAEVIDILKNNDEIKKLVSYKEISELINFCKENYGVKINFLPTLVRGLSYYNGSIFEVKSEDFKESLGGGGSYLVNGIESTGFSFGLERICQLAKIDIKKEKILIISLGKDKEAIRLAKKIRSKQKIVSIFYGKPSKALEYANSYRYTHAIFVGEEETKKNKFKIKDLTTGEEKKLEIDND
ncbi:MAG: ATP phosphoribosyltransferase regulatory subunit [Candidatus Pacearchaeota archaeon]